MGGQREDTIETPAKKSKKSDVGGESGEISGKIRFHEDPATGQVHFHDDANKLKVAIPVADWYMAWRRIKHANHHLTDAWHYVDTINKTLLTIKSGYVTLASSAIDCDVTISSIQLGETYQKLDKFMPTRK